MRFRQNGVTVLFLNLNNGPPPTYHFQRLLAVCLKTFNMVLTFHCSLFLQVNLFTFPVIFIFPFILQVSRSFHPRPRSSRARSILRMVPRSVMVCSKILRMPHKRTRMTKEPSCFSSSRNANLGVLASIRIRQESGQIKREDRIPYIKMGNCWMLMKSRC